jgi:chondroitin synthase
LAYHQEPPGAENETDRVEGKKQTMPKLARKVHYSYRRPRPNQEMDNQSVPLVSIYIPCFNSEKYIVKCIESALGQTIKDLEVCVCDDGSTDSTWEILKNKYGTHPRVKLMTKENGGIGSASNAAVSICRGHYIGQLDSDDYLESDAVEVCLNEFHSDLNLACVYTTYRNVDEHGKKISDGYNWPEYDREKFTTAMIVHHFRMFTARAWSLTSGFNEEITNAVDYDMYLKLSEVGPLYHVNKICYNRTLHGENTSIRKIKEQKINHYKVINQSLERQGIKNWRIIPSSVNDDKSRAILFENRLM